MTESRDWRPLVAALANGDARRVFARITLGLPRDEVLDGFGEAKGARILDTLRRSGLVIDTGDDLAVDASVFTSALASASVAEPRRTGPDRFLTADGRIDRYPAGSTDRRALLTHLAQRTFRAGVVYTERDVTDQLDALTDDVALLRRYLVDFGILDRTRDGSSYVLVGGAHPDPQ